MKNSSLSAPSNFSVEIESLRGIAALLVLFGHLYLVVALPLLVANHAILRAFLMSVLDPQPPVLLFFTISGLVLGRQLRKDPIEGFPSFIAYLCRRGFRLIPLIWVSTFFAFILSYCINPLSMKILYSTLLLQDISLNVPLWSIQVELWCSLFFPILFWMFRSSGLIYNLLLFIGFTLLSCFGDQPIFIQFLVFFHAGLLIDVLSANTQSPKFKKPWIFLVAYLVFILAPEFGIGPRNWIFGHWQSWVLPEILACSLILFFIVHNKNTPINSFLRLSWIRYLGKISFSIYLLHFPLLLFMLVKFPVATSFQLVAFSGCFVGLTILLSSLTYRWIEVPFNKLGRKLYTSISTNLYSNTVHDV